MDRAELRDYIKMSCVLVKCLGCGQIVDQTCNPNHRCKVRSADEIAYEITAVYYDDDKVVKLIRKAREEMRQECLNVVRQKLDDDPDDWAEQHIKSIPNR